MPVSLIIPTFRRPEALKTALHSVFAQTGVEVAVNIIVCDNSPEGSARAMVESLTPGAGQTLIYLHEPNPGVANARNTAVKAAHDPFILFLDDDEEAPSDWVAKMLSAQQAFGADVVFGPVTARLKTAAPQFRPYFEAFFSRFGPAHSGPIPDYYGCGNSLIRRALLSGEQPFDTNRNSCGGEDDKLFYALKQEGARMVWASDAFVWEDVPESRATLRYTLPRAFAYGQGPSTSAMAGTPKKPLTCAYWMLNGLVQALLFGGAGLVLYAAGSKAAARILDKAARGLGKLIWFHKIGFYGTALLKPNPAGR
ncbi:glycosyltransferase [Asticcacaulis sp. DW145]|uniref:Glycosyltransferase family 2 protein n=1 Tax=Asticcacaulis currens TaxID=2984210 RepID=A0ABT5IAQ2_9CAUL|nr:glycosyltransferase family 2 protein [Asticcacaulis currens]MDC7693261.1 glycosyltransferase family 2 protein [Asticcacaulis currens]BEV09853.1 glycosyltransferase [Asticcacaulis sp. DW145]